MEDSSFVVVLALVLLALFGKLVRKIAEAASDRQRGPGPEREVFEATPRQVEDFLRALGQGGEQPAAGPEPAGRPMADVAGPGRPRAHRRRPAAGEVPRRRAAGSVLRRSERQRPSSVPGPRESRGRAAPGLPAAPGPSAATTSSKHSLRDAVVWSEILGPPLSLRDRGRRRPPVR
jgi:hypothetical protein